MGVIDTLSAGFRLVFRKPWLALIPALIDAGLWIGPKFSIAGLVGQFTAWLTTSMTAMAGSSQTTAQTVSDLASTLNSTVANLNLLGLLAWNRLGITTVSASIPIAAGDRVIEITQAWELPVVAAAILAIGLLLGTAYLTLIAQYMREEPLSPPACVQWVLKSWASLAVLFAVIGCAFFTSIMLSSIVGPLALLVLLALFWALLYASFFPQAVTFGGHKPLNAVISSLFVVRRNLWPTLGLLVLVNLLDTGLSLVWQRAADISPISMLLAIVASALIGTGLTAALFYFYRDRAAALRSLILAQRQA